ncbi:MAG: cation:proton antiporter [Ktedonobacterales bacterium]
MRFSWRESLALGALMNARGLIELILLDIGLEAGIITPTLFTMLVMMALITTLLTTPLYRLFYGRHIERERKQQAIAHETSAVASPLALPMRSDG